MSSSRILLLLLFVPWFRPLAVAAGDAEPVASIPDFDTDIVPILTKYGCNGGRCHGKAEGRNGFKLSLFGFDPDLDYAAVVDEARGRRVRPGPGGESLLLRKPAGALPHEGGHLLDPAGEHYATIARWIAAGAPRRGTAYSPVVRIQVHPSASVVLPGDSEALRVTATHADGRVADVTELAEYRSADRELVTVSDEGRVRAAGTLAGQVGVLVRYLGQLDVFRATVPRATRPATWPDWDSANFVDGHVGRALERLGIPPSRACSDGEFIRRASLDICGTLPTVEETAAFLADRDEEKRRRLIDRLLEKPEYASLFALKWGDILRIRRDDRSSRMRGTYLFHGWLTRAFLHNMPYDDLVRRLLTVTGETRFAPAAMWYRELGTPEALVDDVAQVFLGTKIQCARCHHHPFERWSQTDYYGMASFFARLGRKTLPPAGDEPVLYVKDEGQLLHPRTGETVTPFPLGADRAVWPQPAAGADPRERLAAWMTAPANPYFARALVNRMWAHFFGRGLSEPIDDLRRTNPPSHPELLDALAADFVEHEFDLKHLIRTICASRTYQLSSIPIAGNASDTRNFARAQPRRLQAEVLLDALSVLTGSAETLDGLPAGARAIELPDEVTTNRFLMLFGKPRRATSCECERSSDPSLGQSLHLVNSEHVLGKLRAPNGRVARYEKDARSHEERVRELYLLAFARLPTQAEERRSLAHLVSAENPRQGYEDLIWALANTREFQFNH